MNQKTNTNTLPAAEATVIGSILNYPDVMDDTAVILNPGDFSSRALGEIYQILLDMNSVGDFIDFVTVSNKTDAAGIPLNILTDCARHITPHRAITPYARIVRADSVRRATVTMAGDVINYAKEHPDEDAEEYIAHAEGLFTSLSISRAHVQAVPIKTALGDVMSAIEARHAGTQKANAIQTPWHEVNVKLCGGLAPGDLVVLAGRPSMGKSAAALGIADHAAEQGVASHIVSMEMPCGQLVERHMAVRSNVSMNEIITGKIRQDSWPKLTHASTVINQMPIFINDQQLRSVSSIVSEARLMKRRHGIGVLIIDYLQLIDLPRDKNSSKADLLSDVTRSLKLLAKELSIPVVLLSQVNRECESRVNKRPLISDLRGCLPTEEWVDTPTGPVQLKTKPKSIITAGRAGVFASDCGYIYKKQNRVYRVRTQFGTFHATARHPVLTGVGWKKVRDLVPGRDVIACPKKIPHANNGSVPGARLLGWLLGNGGFGGTPSLIFRTELTDVVNFEVEKFGVTVRPRRQQHSPNVVAAYLSNGVETGSLPNPLMLWIRQLGLENKTHYDKTIPSCFLGSSDDTHRDLLRGLWETDGTVTNGVAKYTTVSEILARQIKWLLHTIGVRSTVNFYEQIWEVRCAKEDNPNMASVCNFPGRFGELAVPSSDYVDPAPSIFVELVNELGIGGRRFQKKKNGKYKSTAKEALLDVLRNHPVSTILESPYIQMQNMGWGRLHSVELIDEKVNICDLMVPGTHNFLSNGIVVHNSGSIEQDSDVIIMLFREEVYDQTAENKNVAEMEIAKQRNGPVGTVRLKYVKHCTRFEDYDPATISYDENAIYDSE